jgi:hypothetical protein
MTHDPVNHPKHYTSHPSGRECIEFTRHMNFNVGNAFKYLWRAGLKGTQAEDLRKALWYLEDEIDTCRGRSGYERRVETACEIVPLPDVEGDSSLAELVLKQLELYTIDGQLHDLKDAADKLQRLVRQVESAEQEKT